MTGPARSAAVRLQLLAVCIFALVQAGCPANIAAIQQSDLSPADKAAHQVFQAESQWVAAKKVLVDVLLNLQLSGVEIPERQRDQIREALDAGNAAVLLARAALSRGELTGPNGVATALESLQKALIWLNLRRGVLPIPGTTPAPTLVPEAS